MSLRYRSGSGVETILAGLTPGGDLEYGAVATRSGTATITAPSTIGAKVDTTITFTDPMPDGDFIVTFAHNELVDVFEMTPGRSANGFIFRTITLSTGAAGQSVQVNWKAFKLYEVQHAEQNAEDIANIKSMIPANASAANKLATSSDVTSLSTEVDGRLDDLEDVVPTSASITNKLVTQSELQAIEEADSITYDNTTSELTATNVQDALDEIDAAVDGKLNVKTISSISQVPQGDMAFLEDGIYYITSSVVGGNLINLPSSLQYLSGAMVIIKTAVTNALYKTYIYSPWDVRLPMFKGEVSFSSSQNPTIEWTPQIASNPNIIDNAWFTINQRGQSSYSAYAYTLDRWRNASSAGVITVSPTSDGITIVNNHETSRGYFYQYFENMLPAGETYTLSVKSTQTKRWILQVRYNDGGTKSYAGVNVDPTSPEIMQYTFTATKPIDAILIETQAQSTTNIRAVKLEKGRYSTLALDSEPNYATELAKCQRYFYRIKSLDASNWITFAMVWSPSAMNYFIPCPTTMRTIPSITVSNLSDLIVCKGATTNSRKTPSSINCFISNATSLVGTIVTSETDLTLGDMYVIKFGNATDYIDFSADL